LSKKERIEPPPVPFFCLSPSYDSVSSPSCSRSGRRTSLPSSQGPKLSGPRWSKRTFPPPGPPSPRTPYNVTCRRALLSHFAPLAATDPPFEDLLKSFLVLKEVEASVHYLRSIVLFWIRYLFCDSPKSRPPSLNGKEIFLSFLIPPNSAHFPTPYESYLMALLLRPFTSTKKAAFPLQCLRHTRLFFFGVMPT